MSKELATVETEVRTKRPLKAIEHRIISSAKKVLDYWMDIGWDFHEIEEHDLYKQADCDTFREYIEANRPDGESFSNMLGLDYKRIRKIMSLSVIYRSISDAIPEGSGIEAPRNTWVVEEMLTMQPTEAADFYIKAAQTARKEGVPVTRQFLIDFKLLGGRDIEAAVLPEDRTTATGTASVEEMPNDIDFSQEQSAPTPSKLRNADMMRCLEKIDELSNRGVFSSSARKIIEQEHIKVANEDLELWGRQDDETKFIKIGRLIFGSSLSVRDALLLINKKLDENTSIKNFVYHAISMGKGGAWVDFNDYHISAMPLSKK